MGFFYGCGISTIDTSAYAVNSFDGIYIELFLEIIIQKAKFRLLIFRHHDRRYWGMWRVHDHHQIWLNWRSCSCLLKVRPVWLSRWIQKWRSSFENQLWFELAMICISWFCWNNKSKFSSSRVTGSCLGGFRNNSTLITKARKIPNLGICARSSLTNVPINFSKKNIRDVKNVSIKKNKKSEH